jgi:colicin import membrane protein
MMSDENNNQKTAEELEAERLAQAEADAKKSVEDKDKDLIAKLVQEKVAEQLKDTKKLLDNAYKQRDEALAKQAEIERKEKEAELKRLEEQGKHKEIAELKLAEANAKLAALEKQNTELSRDVAVRDALKGLDFRNAKAFEMAQKEIVDQLIQNDKNQWVHRSGISINDFVTAFASAEEQSFLFKVKASSGAGTQNSSNNGGGGSGSGENKSLFSMSQAEVIKLAAEGKIGKR